MHANPIYRKAGGTSEGLAVEQLVVLCQGRGRVGNNRSIRRINARNNETKTPTRKPDVWGTQFHLLTWCPDYPPDSRAFERFEFRGFRAARGVWIPVLNRSAFLFGFVIGR